MAWDKKPLPGTPLRREVIGIKLKLIASGFDGTVSSHSQWLLAVGSPPLFEHITVNPCKMMIFFINYKLNIYIKYEICMTAK